MAHASWKLRARFAQIILPLNYRDSAAFPSFSVWWKIEVFIRLPNNSLERDTDQLGAPEEARPKFVNECST